MGSTLLNFKNLWINAFSFFIFLIISFILYLTSLKLIGSFNTSEDGLIANYANYGKGSIISNFITLLKSNLKGNFYYGENLNFLILIVTIIGILYFFIEKKYLWTKLLTFIFILIAPFSISLITKLSGNPPRLYVGSTIVFAFFLTFGLKKINNKYYNQILFISLIIFLWNSFYIFNLFNISNKIYKIDLNYAERINNNIIDNIPDFNSEENYVYFYGTVSNKLYEKVTIPEFEKFSGSVLRWDGGNNIRILSFFKNTNIGYYKFLDNEEEFNKIKDSIQNMPIFPTVGSIRKFNNTVVVKLGSIRGVPLPFEKVPELNYKIKKTLTITKINNLPNENPLILGNIDQFSQDKYKVSISGWVIYKDTPSINTETSIVVFNNKHIFSVETNKSHRYDITDHFNDGTDYNSSGFFAEYDITGLPKGTYELGIRLNELETGKDGIFKTDKIVEIK